MKNFALTGVAGYIAPRHLKAIKDTGNRLVAAVDPHDSVGILDSYFPDASYFTEFERFDRHLEMLRRNDGRNRANYLSICSPNHLHDAHMRLALRIGADAICEKPLVLNPWNLDQLQELEADFGARIYTILQLRVHPSLIRVKCEIDRSTNNTKHNVRLRYITTRGKWYRYSWKGNNERSGGITTNIGIHFFDLLIWLFSRVQESIVNLLENEKAGGILELEKARVEWFLSLDAADLPEEHRKYTKRATYRSISVDGEEKVLPKRLKKYSLSLNQKLIELGKKDSKKSATFNFLGFTHYMGKSRKGRSILKRKTSSKKFRMSLKRVNDWLRNNRHQNVGILTRLLNQKLRGHYGYYGITFNTKEINAYYEAVKRILHYWLNRRGGKRKWIWEEYVMLITVWKPLIKPKIYHSYQLAKP